MQNYRVKCKKRLPFGFFIVILIFEISLLHLGKVSAQTLLRYPIPELGYCRDAKECYLYCEIPPNKAACWSYGKYKLGPQVLGETTTLSPQEKAAMEAKARELGITFPIAELGNCAGPQACKDYCDQPANYATCMNFAQKHGFDRQPGGGQMNEQEIMQAARTELGCTSIASCRQLCESDHERCLAFAKRYGLYKEQPESQSGVSSGADKAKLMEDAKKELGCTSMESCAKTCEQNRERCMEFARKWGLDHGEGQPEGGYQGQMKGPGGCDSESSCRTYCREHPSECPGYQEYQKSDNYPTGYSTGDSSLDQGTSGSYLGPSGCRTEAECEAYCRINPSSCPGFKAGDTQPTPSYVSPSGATMYPQ